MADININPEPPKPFTVNLLGTEYTVRPIKMSMGLTLAGKFQNASKDGLAAQKAVTDLVKLMFGPTDAKKVSARLTDPADDLDYPHIVTLMEALVEKTTGNPTT